MAPFTLALLRSALGRFFGRWYFTCQCSFPGAVDQVDDVPCSLAGTVGFLFTPSYRQIQADLPSALALVPQSSRLCDRWFLTHRRFPQRSRSVVSPAVRSTVVSLPTGCLPSFLPQGGLSSLLLYPPSQTRSIPESPKLPRIHKTLQSRIDALVSSRSHRLIIHQCNEQGPLRRVSRWWSLSRMGLKQERWNWACHWFSRLDVNTCHIRTYKPVYFWCISVIPILGTKATRHHSGSQRTEQREVAKRTNTGLPNTYHMTKLRKQS